MIERIARMTRGRRIGMFSHALTAGIRPDLVQRWLGHSSLVMPVGTYGQFIPGAGADAADAAKLGSILRA